ncbi:MAG: glycosyltransferase family 2 protein [Atopobiaceae bacterium]|nr:glycosyltransferase family 2 protein [Atopobiaceae bacterium]
MYDTTDHTFVVCAYGESPYLGECVSSLMAQTAKSTVIMATSTPNDSIRKVADDFGLPLYESGEESGIARDWNHAVSRAKTPLVTIAHQDDTYEPRYAQVMLEGMSQAQDPLIFFSNYGELRDGAKVDDNQLLRIKRMLLRPMKRRRSTSSSFVKRSILSLGSSICCPSVTLNMDLLPTPPFTSGMKSNLDWDAWERFSRMDGSFVYSPEILMHHRIHEESETSNLIRDNTRTKEDLAMLMRFWPAPVARLINVVYARGQRSNG